jgi:regulator of sigma E protease
MITVLIVIAILVLLIVTHELGHFIAAKLFGVRVEEFGIGYPPRALSFGTWGGTEYTLNWIPFGGFVRLYGEDADASDKGSFNEAKHYKQAIILVAGVAMNALVAWLLFAAALHIGIPQVVDSGTLPPTAIAHLEISDVVAGSPASIGGINAGDEILSMIDAKGVTLTILTPKTVSDYVKVRGGQKITIVYMHGIATSSTTIIPANAVIPGSAATPALGVGLVEVSNVSLPWKEALRQGFTNTGEAFKTVGISLWDLVTGIFHGSTDLRDVVGPVGLVGVVGQAAQNGAGQVLALAGFIAVNLAIINLIPIPALDGGRLVIVAFETIIRRKAPPLLVKILNTIGIALIILLMLTVTYHDIARLLV